MCLITTENLDEMLLQFRGREEELVMTLRTMRINTASTNSDSTMEMDYGASLTTNQEDGSIVFESDKEASSVATDDVRRSPYPDDISGSSYSSDSGNIGE